MPRKGESGFRNRNITTREPTVLSSEDLASGIGKLTLTILKKSSTKI